MLRFGTTMCLRALAGFGEILFSRWGAAAPRGLWLTVALWLVVMGAGLALNRECFRPHELPIPNDQHAMLSLELAIHHQRFGSFSQCYRKNWSETVAPARDAYIFTLLPNNPEMLGQRLRDLPERCNPSTADYVQYLEPVVNNENSLMLIDRAVLGIVPDITLAGMVQAHLVLKIACLAIFVFFLLRVGASALFSLAAFHVAMLLIRQISQTHPVSIYPFMMPLTLLLVALLGLTLSFGLHRRIWQLAPALLVIGFVGAFLANMRSSYFMVVMALTLVYVAFVATDLWRRQQQRWRRVSLLAVVSCACVAGGFMAFTRMYIAPIVAASRTEKNGTYTYHVVAHPLVLFLSIPANDLATREGIEMDDFCGLKLARRIDPSVVYLGKNYDDALFVYYFKLWLYYPAEMAQLYQLKFKTAAATTAKATPVSGTNSAKLLHVLATPLRKCGNWIAYLGLFTALAVTPLFLIRLVGLGRAFGVSALATAGLLLFLEQALFPSNFMLTYNSYLFFWIVFAGALCYQAGADGAVHVIQWGWQRLRGSRQPSAPRTDLSVAA